MRLVGLGFLVLLAACTPAAAPPTAVMSNLGTVTITAPAEGTVYYGGFVTAYGTAQALPADGFDLVVAAEAESVRVRVVPQGSTWSAVVPFPAAESGVLTLQAAAIGRGWVYDTVIAAVGRPEDRPEGVYGLILSPTADDAPGGEQIMVRGVVSSVTDDVQLVLTSAQGQEVQRVAVQLPMMHPLDEIPFQVDIVTGGNVGLHTLTLRVSDTVLDEVTFMLSTAAG